MSRSGYSDDCENVQLYRAAVDAATFGKRGQAFLKRLRDALDAMPAKRLITEDFSDRDGNVCALGAIDPNPRRANGHRVDPEDAEDVARHFGIATALAAEIIYMNDEEGRWRQKTETPEERWTRMRAWVDKQIGPDLAEDAR